MSDTRIGAKVGAVAVLAHPGRSKGIYAVPADDADIEALVEVGLDGIEVFYPSHSAEQRELYGMLAAKYGLLVSGGSDSHHPTQPLANVEADQVRELLERLGVG